MASEQRESQKCTRVSVTRSARRCSVTAPGRSGGARRAFSHSSFTRVFTRLRRRAARARRTHAREGHAPDPTGKNNVVCVRPQRKQRRCLRFDPPAPAASGAQRTRANARWRSLGRRGGQQQAREVDNGEQRGERGRQLRPLRLRQRGEARNLIRQRQRLWRACVSERTRTPCDCIKGTRRQVGGQRARQRFLDDVHQAALLFKCATATSWLCARNGKERSSRRVHARANFVPFRFLGVFAAHPRARRVVP